MVHPLQLAAPLTDPHPKASSCTFVAVATRHPLGRSISGNFLSVDARFLMSAVLSALLRDSSMWTRFLWLSLARASMRTKLDSLTWANVRKVDYVLLLLKHLPDSGRVECGTAQRNPQRGGDGLSLPIQGTAIAVHHLVSEFEVRGDTAARRE